MSLQNIWAGKLSFDTFFWNIFQKIHLLERYPQNSQTGSGHYRQEWDETYNHANISYKNNKRDICGVIMLIALFGCLSLVFSLSFRFFTIFVLFV